MNSLNRDIERGEQVIVYQHIFPGKPLEQRVFTVDGGPGLSKDHHQTVITGITRWGEPGNIYGGWIDPAATKEWQDAQAESG